MRAVPRGVLCSAVHLLCFAVHLCFFTGLALATACSTGCLESKGACHLQHDRLPLSGWLAGRDGGATCYTVARQRPRRPTWSRPCSSHEGMMFPKRNIPRQNGARDNALVSRPLQSAATLALAHDALMRSLDGRHRPSDAPKRITAPKQQRMTSHHPHKCVLQAVQGASNTVIGQQRAATN